ncbi:hypothetical protein EVJ58_g637 [Rhodofomes roseus]|uniref:Nucleolar 27S pre-rRNA processing Urb2/Npa2 C-terminal domain-containing protein n=1 Tax=Rhodofomes roseus TaxID=34475 RepID=A0A4Y9Z4M0_9APHY|nr:hypothetical protein EVJ58_g637 [Rhodofomes roseus]
MVTSTLGSAQDFVHTLKAHLDPPLANGSSKIELAREAWETTSFYFPNKDEVIVDWLLTRLLKDKAKAGDASPILDSRYWQLLSDIVCPPDETNVKRTNTSRTAKRWLLPLLNRIPVAPIVTAYFSLSGPLDEHARVTLDKFFSRCLVTIWPLATPKFSPDVLLECFGALLVHLTTRRAGEDDPTNATAHVGKAALLVISSYRTAYGNLANKKKLYTTFLQHHFLHWLQCIQYGVPHDAARLTPISDVYLAGIETLFSVDVLRNVEDHKCDAALKDAISQSSHLSSKAVLHALPLLLTSFVQSLKKNRNALFSQGSSNAAGHASMQVQPAGLAFYALCENILDAAPTPDSTQIWDTRVALLETVDSESLYNPSDANGTEVLRNSGAMAVRVVTYIQEDVAFLDKAEDVLAILTRIDYDLMAPELPVLWPALARTSSNSSSSAYLRLLFEFRTKTRTVNTLVDSWLDAVSLRHWQTCEVQPREAYARVLGSPLFSFESIDRLGQAVHGFLTPSQIVDVTRIIVEKFTGAFQRFREQDKRVAADDGDGSRKKRKKSTSDNVRTLLNDAAISDDHAAQDIIDAVLRCLEGLQNHDGVAELRWSGKSHELGNDASQAVVAILHLTLIRWLPLFDSRASAEQMIKLAKVILTISRTSSSSSTSNQQLTPSTVLAVTFHNADVWELRRFRALASINVHDFLSGKRRSVPRKLRADISASIAGFEILLYMPEEYLSRALRSDFLHRALVADILIGAGAITDSSVDARALLKAREFIRRAVSHTGSVDQLAVDGYFGYLLKSDALPPVDEQHDLVSVTLDLIGACLVAFVRNSRNGEDTLALAAVQNISGILDVPVEQRTRPSSLITNGTLLRLISVVASNHELSQLSQQLQKSLRELYERLSEPHANFRNSRLDALRMWSHALWLGRWLKADMSSLPRFGSILLGQLVADRQQSRSTATYLSLLDVLKEELYSSATENRHAYIGYLVADYLTDKSLGVQDLDASFSGISKSMPIEDYSALVGYIVEVSAKPTSFSASDNAPMVRLLKIVGLNAPEGTSKITQQAISKTLLLCADRPNYLSVPEIRREVLGLLSGYCSERPASVRSSDMSTIWSILGQLLANSSEHDQTTDPAIFQEAVSIVSALVRLRRDLILNTLPHLGMILRRLISALRGLRPQLGAKQTRLVMNTLPAWISTEKPLSAEEPKHSRGS